MRFAKVMVRNVAGYALLMAGLCLSLPLIPGPGFVFVFAGLALADWPGKTPTFRWLHTYRWFAKVDCWCHKKFGFRMPEHDHHQMQGPPRPFDMKRSHLYESART